MEQFSLMTVLGYAFVGGVILNAMPCVFPMLGIKLMSVVKKADATPASIRMSGILYTLGVIASFLIFAGINCCFKRSRKECRVGFSVTITDVHCLSSNAVSDDVPELPRSL